MTFTALSTGCNLGDRGRSILLMERELSLLLTDVRTSPLMETAPVGVYDEQPPYLNKIIAGYYAGDPYQLLAACQSIESRLGRVRGKPKAARAADIDILIFGDAVINDCALTIPHPEILNRRFCIEGLARIVPLTVFPGDPQNLTFGDYCKNMSADVAAQNILLKE